MQITIPRLGHKRARGFCWLSLGSLTLGEVRSCVIHTRRSLRDRASCAKKLQPGDNLMTRMGVVLEHALANTGSPACQLDYLIEMCDNGCLLF